MRVSAVFHFQGLLALLVGGSMLLPLAVSLLYGEGDAGAFAISILISGAIGTLLFWPMRGKVQSVTRREAFAIVSLGWLIASALGAIPFMLAGTFSSYLDAYFETMSGFTTTGASVLADIEAEPHGILLWRSFTQWLGGVGIVVLFVAIFPLLGVGAAQLYEYEAPGPPSERITPRIRETAKILWLIYLAFSATEWLLLMVVGMSPYDALNHMFATMATGGYSTKNTSVAFYQSPWVDYVIGVFMLAAGVNFSLYYLVWRRNPGKMIADREFRFYLFLVAASVALIVLDLMANRGFNPVEGVRYAFFQVSSIQTTTGFATADFNLWPPLSQAILVALMFVGGSSGSTGGAMKVIRIWVLLKFAYREIYIAFHPRAILPLKIAGKPVSEKVLHEVLGFSILYILLFVAATIFLTIFGLDLVTSFTAVAATLGNVGPGLALVGPVANYSQLPDAVKAVLTFCMFAGRLELWTVFVLLRPSFWQGR
jgi:trk system potassium uptake protein TrkH